MAFHFQKRNKLGEFNLFSHQSWPTENISTINKYIDNLETKYTPVPIAYLSFSRMIASTGAMKVLIIKILKEYAHQTSTSVCRDIINGYSLLEIYDTETLDNLKRELNKKNIGDFTIIPARNRITT